MLGKQYNRAVRCHKLMFEALSRLRFIAYLETLSFEKEENVLNILGAMVESIDDSTYEDYVTSPLFIDVIDGFTTFVQKKCSESKLFKFWSTYIEMVQLMLLHVRATRTGDWNLHLSVVKSMLPWFFVTNRTNYSRYASCYWIEMTVLEQTHPGIYIYFFLTITGTKDYVFLCHFIWETVYN